MPIKLSEYPPFPFTYVGGGYFRYCGVPKGKAAMTLHGNEVLKEYEKYLQTFIDADEESAKLNPEL